MSINIAALSYGMAAVAFLALSLLQLRNLRRRLYAVVLTIACLITLFWSATISCQIAYRNPFNVYTDMLELLRSAAWSVFFLMLTGLFHKANNSATARLKPAVIFIAAFYALHFIFTLYTYWKPVPVQNETVFMLGITARMAMAVIGMLLVEQYYRNTAEDKRWGVKFICIGIGGMFAYDFYLYSDALMFRQLDKEVWAARGLVNALIVPLIALSAARNPSWSSEISVSRSILLHSTTLIGAAIYLLLMSAAGYYLRVFGGSWGVVMQTSFLFIAIVLLFSILFSGTTRSWLKVFISKHFYNYNYDYREEWLRFTRTLSQEGQGLGERSIQAVAALVESPGGILFINRDAKDCISSAYWNMPATVVSEPANAAFCHYLETRQWVIDLQECAGNPEKYEEISIPDWLKNYPKAWLIGRLFGFIILAQSRSKIKLNWEVIDLLKIAGSQAASYLAQEESAHALMVARQFESFNRMSTFVVHDLKNLISQLSLLLTNSERHKNNPEFQKDMLDTLNLSVQKMKLLLHKLGRDGSLESPAPLSIAGLLQHTVKLKSAFEPQPELEISDSSLMILANWDRLERVLGHLIQNAIEATPKDGRVIIRVEQHDDAVQIEITDTGLGMSETFIHERLFKPFESTKSAGMGIGVFESREYINDLGGQLQVSSSLATGTKFQVILPLYKQRKLVESYA
jgi:putative PEP-CTERM system histidine kinase